MWISILIIVLAIFAGGFVLGIKYEQEKEKEGQKND